MNDKSRTGVGAPQPISEILDGVSIPFAYKFGYLVNSYREPSFRSIESKLGLTRPEILTLIFLFHRDGITASEICDFSGHLKNNISRAVTALEKKALIRRVPDVHDQRRLLLYITVEGQRMHQCFMPGLQERERAMMSALTTKESTELTRLLQKLCTSTPNWCNQEHV
ncbi:MarR family transcriptional regulator [Limnohabitans sp. 2KL-1]|jgi:DNA-binding MarR family transcriptional regulator|uniref:MarR family winged helix-turn-helix transcriptional regulator n=1 Tax=Limnohabitans sp. 2KL-1 TaxID=1100699 RepID=UPI000D3DAE35|nr:MarR family winged helix-turn-helix transcriptional regulator [Limnohabitans sp. 2KL-1]PUE50618.1 MarR family transcriptional regulator [Limnohabitans sp. 2KL-1]